MVIIKRLRYEHVGIIISERLDNATYALRVSNVHIKQVGCVAAKPHISYAKQELRIVDSLLREATRRAL